MPETIKGTDVTFVNTSSEVKKAMESLAKKALRRSAKVITNVLTEGLPARYGLLKNHIKTAVNISREGSPQMKVGLMKPSAVRKKGKKPSHANPHWVEFGTSPHMIIAKNVKSLGPGGIYGKEVNHPGAKATHVLRNTVHDNIEEIKDAQADFLAQLTEMSDAAIAAMETEPDDEDDD